MDLSMRRLHFAERQLSSKMSRLIWLVPHCTEWFFLLALSKSFEAKSWRWISEERERSFPIPSFWLDCWWYSTLWENLSLFLMFLWQRDRDVANYCEWCVALAISCQFYDAFVDEWDHSCGDLWRFSNIWVPDPFSIITLLSWGTRTIG